jgi:transmembrane 9 superfamily protein 3
LFSALLGETDPATKAVTVYTHKRFEIGYNDDKIVDVSVVVENKKPLIPNQELEFTYEVVWKPSSVSFEKRFEKYLDPNFFQHRVSLLSMKVTYIPYFRFTGSPFSTHS